jgi:EmrB/QacA subfamily drug resistance transporter
VKTETIDDLFVRFGPKYRWLITVTGMTASFTMVLTGTIVNVAIPDVMGAYGVGQDKAQFLQTAFITTMTASQLLNAWVIAKLGQRLAFMSVLVLFLIGGIVCGISPTLDGIIFGRVLQGFAAGIVQPLVMVTLFQVFPPDRRGFAMGIYGVGLMLALGFGPVVGGITSDAFNWRLIFYVPLPLVIVALVGGWIFMPSRRPPGTVKPFDWIGYILLCTALYCMMTVIGTGQREGWGSDGILALILIGVGTGFGFVISQFREASSLLDMSLLRNPQFSSAIFVAFVFGAGNFAITYAIPVFGQLVQGYTPTLAGLLLLPASLLVVAMLPFTGRLSDVVAPSYPIMGGLAMFALAAIFLASVDVNTSFWTMAFFCIVGRFGMAFISPALMASALRSVPADKLNEGSGTINFFRQLGGATGINTLVVALEWRTQFHSDSLTQTQTAGNTATREFLSGIENLLGEAGVPASVQPSLALDYLGKMLQSQADTMGFQDGFMLIAIVFIVALVPAYILSRTR